MPTRNRCAPDVQAAPLMVLDALVVEAPSSTFMRVAMLLTGERDPSGTGNVQVWELRGEPRVRTEEVVRGGRVCERPITVVPPAWFVQHDNEEERLNQAYIEWLGTNPVYEWVLPWVLEDGGASRRALGPALHWPSLPSRSFASVTGAMDFLDSHWPPCP